MYLKTWIDAINPYFKNLGFTPNMITTISFLCGLIACYLYYKKSYILAGLVFFVSYFFDVMDGYFARIYDMKSKFGSYYDSITDIVVGLIFVYLFLTNKQIIKVKYINLKVVITLFYVFLTSLVCYHMACQEKYTNDKNSENVSDGLAFLQVIKCKNYEIMKYSRYFSTGFFNICFSLGIFSHIFFTKK